MTTDGGATCVSCTSAIHPDCTSVSANGIIQGCGNGMIVDHLRTTCVKPVDFCKTPLATNHEKCSECKGPLHWLKDEDTCEACTAFEPDCATVNNDGIIQTCTTESKKVPEHGGKFCVLPSPNCLKLDSTTKKDCTTCKEGFTLNPNTKQCIDCRDGSIEGCLECRYNASVTGHEFSCDKCDKGRFLSKEDSLCPLIITNCETYNLDDPVFCDKCGKGFAQDPSYRTCQTCSSQLNYPEGRCLTCDTTPKS